MNGRLVLELWQGKTSIAEERYNQETDIGYYQTPNMLGAVILTEMLTVINFNDGSGRKTTFNLKT